MIIKIRTKDDLMELLKKGISHSWKISEWRLNHLNEVHIYEFSGKSKIKGEFDREHSQILENGRVAIAFKNATIIPEDYKWIGQNPIKFETKDIETNQFNQDLSDPNKNQNCNETRDESFQDIEMIVASEFVQKINPDVFKFISDFFETKDHDDFKVQITKDDCLRISSTYPKADETTSYYAEINSTGIEFYFSNRYKGFFFEILNEFDDFESYFEIDYDNGSQIARMLSIKYKEVYEDRIENGDDLELDEDFTINFKDNFVNYILNDVYFE